MIETPSAQTTMVDVSALPFREWRCTGTRSDGRPCNNVLNEYAYLGSVKLRKRCDKCKTWNTLQR